MASKFVALLLPSYVSTLCQRSEKLSISSCEFPTPLCPRYKWMRNLTFFSASLQFLTEKVISRFIPQFHINKIVFYILNDCFIYPYLLFKGDARSHVADAIWCPQWHPQYPTRLQPRKRKRRRRERWTQGKIGRSSD